MAGFSPTITSHRKNAGEILDSLRLSLPTVAPGQTPGALRFVSLALHILPHKGERRRRYVSARNASELYFHPETRFSKARPLLSLHTRPQKSRGTQQAWMNSRNQITIARRSKHRQLVLLHPTDGMSSGGTKGHDPGACRFRPQPLHYRFSVSFN